MSKKCDNKSVGMIVYKGDELLLIERMKKPFGFAPPAGHVDDHGSFEDAAREELEEEVGLQTKKLELIAEGRKENACRRKGGNYHYWKIYRAMADGEVHRSIEETKQVDWYSKEQLASLAEKTEKYLDGGITDSEWEERPGLEPVWYEWLKELRII